MSEGFKLKIDAGINIKEDYYWELYTHDAERDPRYKSLIIDDRPPYRRCERVSFEEIIRNHLNRNDFFDFEYSPKIGDRLFLSFYFESQLLKYHFTYNSVKKIWDIPVRPKDEIYCVEKCNSGGIINPLMLLVDWVT
ncbi:MAG: hypothetical protein MK211_03995 [Flavobacteriales bacterium]|jgi:hypothetical protein|uniref:hypothetical protein n=1 Tax=Candidatus Ulvibacter alkanivorans TaxID=2267620 RepID=UPI000DF20626|nr:hypothetical protein [Candidatus Ulvibacter alkanivorans]MCH2489290.1 hypothetical protein [Flavobacteriales bacterium]